MRVAEKTLSSYYVCKEPVTSAFSSYLGMCQEACL